MFGRLLYCCQDCPFLALQLGTFCPSQWLVIQVNESSSLHLFLLNFFLYSLGYSLGDATLPGDWAPVALSIYMDFALISLLRFFYIN